MQCTGDMVDMSDFYHNLNDSDINNGDAEKLLQAFICTADPKIGRDNPTSITLEMLLRKSKYFKVYVGRNNAFAYMEHYIKEISKLEKILSIFNVPSDPDYLYVETETFFSLDKYFSDLIYKIPAPIEIIKNFCNYFRFHTITYKDQLFGSFTCPPFIDEPAQIIDIDLIRGKAIIKNRSLVNTDFNSKEFTSKKLSEIISSETKPKLKDIIVKTSFSGDSTKGVLYKGATFIGEFQIQQIDLRILKTWSSSITTEQMDSLLDETATRIEVNECFSLFSGALIKFFPKIKALPVKVAKPKPSVVKQPVKPAQKPRPRPKPKDEFALLEKELNNKILNKRFGTSVFHYEGQVDQLENEDLERALRICQSCLTTSKDIMKDLNRLKKTATDKQTDDQSTKKEKLISDIEKHLKNETEKQQRLLELIDKLNNKLDQEAKFSLSSSSDSETGQDSSDYVVKSKSKSGSKSSENSNKISEVKTEIVPKESISTQTSPEFLVNQYQTALFDIKNSITKLLQDQFQKSVKEINSCNDISKTQIKEIIVSVIGEFHIHDSETLSKLLLPKLDLISKHHESYFIAQKRTFNTIYKLIQETLANYEKLFTKKFDVNDAVHVSNIQDIVCEILEATKNHQIIKIPNQIVYRNPADLAPLFSGDISTDFEINDLAIFENKKAIVTFVSGNGVIILTEDNKTVSVQKNMLKKCDPDGTVYDSQKFRVLPGDKVKIPDEAVVINTCGGIAFCRIEKFGVIVAVQGKDINL